MNAYNQLIHRLDTFIRKYYNNRLLKGLILSVSVILLAFLIFVLAEYFGNFSTRVRSVFFFGFLTLLAGVSVFYIFIPLLKLFHIGKLISYKEASRIINAHFPEIKDKIQNALELYEQNTDKENADSLLMAAVNQKIAETELFPFKKAVNYRENLKYLKFALPLLLLFFGLWAFTPSVINESTKRIVNYENVYEKPAPFDFVLLNDTLQVRKGADFDIQLQIKGEYIPDELFISFAGNSFLMKKSKTERSKFSYTFKNLNNSLKFQFAADEFFSDKYQLNVLPAPVLLNFDLRIDVPAYTGEQSRTLTNTGDITVPQGSRLKWVFHTKDSDSLFFEQKQFIKLTKDAGNFVYNRRAMRDFEYSLVLKNQYFTNKMPVRYTVSVRPDLYPAISVEELQDTANFFVHYFNGRIADDYGIKKLTFNYRIVKKGLARDDKSVPFKTDNLPITQGVTSQQFYHLFDFSSLKISDNKEIQYYFQVWDNDAVNGSKSVKSTISSFTIPTKAEINDLKNATSENVQSKLQQAKQLAQEIQTDFQRMQERNLNGDVSDWDNSQMLKSIMDKQNMMQELMKEAKQENESKNKMENTFNKQNEELLKKQQEMQKLMDELLTDEMKELMKQIAELQKEFNEKQMNELLKNQELTMDDMSERLDRNMELLKRFEVEQKMENSISELEKLAQKQEELAEETKQKKSDTKALAEEQKNLEKQFEEMKKEFQRADSLNKELERPMKTEDMQEEFKQIEDEFKKTQENLSKNKRNKASQSQKQNAGNMSKAAGKMQQMMQAGSQSMQSENLESLRQIVDNLITFSFEQEALKKNFQGINHKNPQYIEFVEKQIALKDDYEHISDSLKSLAKRVPQISSTVQKESAIIKDGLNQTIQFLEERSLRTATRMQQKNMTSANNLALLLSEVLDQMKNAQSEGQGDGSNGKPKKGGKKEGFETMKQMQERLKKELEEMKKQMEGGGKLDKNAQNKKLAKMLAQQEIMRQMMQEMRAKQSLNPETQRLLNEIDKMQEQNEKDLVNKRITPELIQRQKMIETRLLEAEKAENKRETEKKRESKQADEKKYTSPEDYFKKNKDKNSMREDLYRNKLILNRFYEKLNNTYSEEIYK